VTKNTKMWTQRQQPASIIFSTVQYSYLFTYLLIVYTLV